MGQYWLPVNLDKKEFFNPHHFGTGEKLVSHLTSREISAAWVILLAAERNERGGGDFHLDFTDLDPTYKERAARIIGRWAGDHVAVVGDYAEDGDLAPEHNASAIYKACWDGDGWQDISEDLRPVVNYELYERWRPASPENERARLKALVGHSVWFFDNTLRDWRPATLTATGDGEKGIWPVVDVATGEGNATGYGWRVKAWQEDKPGQPNMARIYP